MAIPLTGPGLVAPNITIGAPQPDAVAVFGNSGPAPGSPVNHSMADFQGDGSAVEGESWLSFLSPKKGPKLGAVQISASVNESHRFSARVTRHPIESGFGVADHRIIEPFRLSMSAVITDAPTDLLDYAINVPNNQIGKLHERETPQQSFEKLIQMHDTHAVFTVVTGFKLYTNMTFTDLVVNRDRRTGRIVAFTAEMEQLEFVETRIVETTVVPLAQPKENVGEKTKDSNVRMECMDQAETAIRGFTRIGSAPQNCKLIVRPSAPTGGPV